MARNKPMPAALLGACSGRRPAGVFLFLREITPDSRKEFRLKAKNFLERQMPANEILTSPTQIPRPNPHTAVLNRQEQSYSGSAGGFCFIKSAKRESLRSSANSGAVLASFTSL